MRLPHHRDGVMDGMLWSRGGFLPDQTRELRSNLAAVSAHGAANDPGPKSGSATMVNSDINIQTVLLAYGSLILYFASYAMRDSTYCIILLPRSFR